MKRANTPGFFSKGLNELRNIISWSEGYVLSCIETGCQTLLFLSVSLVKDNNVMAGLGLEQ